MSSIFQKITIAGTLNFIHHDLLLSSNYGCVKLDLNGAGKLKNALFGNQIVVVTGTNPDGKNFKVKKMYTNASLPLSQTLPAFSQGLFIFLLI